MKTTLKRVPLMSLCIAVLTACGGGSSGNTSFVAPNSVGGTISGLGSVVVNGVRYETIGASVMDADDGSTISMPMSLGMTVSVEPLTSDGSKAARIGIQTGIKGPASAVNAAALTLNVAGLPVAADASTLVMNSNGLVVTFADLTNSHHLEVYGLPQSDGTFKATRIEIESAAQNIQLVGAVANLNATDNTFTLGNGSNAVTVRYAGAMAPTGLVNGGVVSVHTATTAGAAQYTASRIYLRSASVSTFQNYRTSYRGTSGHSNEANELYGMVSGLTSSAMGCAIQVQGIPVTLSSTTLCASVQNGDYVEVKGLLANGTLVAHRVEFKTAGGDRSLNGYHDDENDSDHDDLIYRRQIDATTSQGGSYSNTASYEIYGVLSACSANTCTLTSNGMALTVDLSTALWEHGQVASGRVEVKGYMLSANTFKAIKIESKN